MSAYQELESLGIPHPPDGSTRGGLHPLRADGQPALPLGQYRAAGRQALGQLRAGLTFSFTHSVAKKMNPATERSASRRSER